VVKPRAPAAFAPPEIFKDVLESLNPMLEGSFPDAFEGLRLIPAFTMETLSEAAIVVGAFFGAGAIINAPGKSVDVSDKLKAAPRSALDDGGSGRGGGDIGGGGGGGGGGDSGAWNYEAGPGHGILFSQALNCQPVRL